MDIKCRLNEYKWIKQNIENLENRLLELDTMLQSVTNPTDSERVQTSLDPDKWTSLIQKRMEIEDLINAEIHNGYVKMDQIEKIITKLPEREKLLMRLRYIDCLTWEEIAVSMNYTWQHMHRIHAQCLKDVIECDSQSVV